MRYRRLGGVVGFAPTYEGMSSPQRPFDAHALYALVASLPEQQKRACALWYVGERAGPLSEIEIAERLGVSQQAAHKLIQKGTARLTVAGLQPKRATRTRAAAVEP